MLVLDVSNQSLEGEYQLGGPAEFTVGLPSQWDTLRCDSESDEDFDEADSDFDEDDFDDDFDDDFEEEEDFEDDLPDEMDEDDLKHV